MFHFTMRLTDNIKRGGVDDDTLSGILPENRRLALESVGFVGHFGEPPSARSKVRNSRATRRSDVKKWKSSRPSMDTALNRKLGPLGSWVRAQRHSMKEMKSLTRLTTLECPSASTRRSTPICLARVSINLIDRWSMAIPMMSCRTGAWSLGAQSEV